MSAIPIPGVPIIKISKRKILTEMGAKMTVAKARFVGKMIKTPPIISNIFTTAIYPVVPKRLKKVNEFPVMSGTGNNGKKKLMPPNKNKKAKIAAGTCLMNFIF